MKKNKPENEREKRRLDELKNNPTGNMRDSFNRNEGTNLVDLVGSLGWKGTLIVIALMIAGFIIYNLI